MDVYLNIDIEIQKIQKIFLLSHFPRYIDPSPFKAPSSRSPLSFWVVE